VEVNQSILLTAASNAAVECNYRGLVWESKTSAHGNNSIALYNNNIYKIIVGRFDARFHSVPLTSASSSCRLITRYCYCNFEFFLFFPNSFSPCTYTSLLHVTAIAATVAFKSPNSVTGRRRWLRRWQRRNNRALGEYIICTQSSSASPLNGIILYYYIAARVARVRVATALPLNCVSGVYIHRSWRLQRWCCSQGHTPSRSCLCTRVHIIYNYKNRSPPYLPPFRSQHPSTVYIYNIEILW